MKRKLLSLAMAFALLSQTLVSAGAIYDWLQAGNYPGSPTQSFYDSSNRFSWTNFGATATTKNATDKVAGEKVKSQVKGEVRASASDAYSSYTSSSTFDYKLSIDMTNVKKAFNDLYSYSEAAITLKDPSGTEGLQTKFDNSKVIGTFTINVRYSAGITPPVVTSPSSIVLNQTGGSASPTYTIASATDDGAGNITITVNANTTIADLSAPTSTILNDLYVEMSGWTATIQNSTITADMSGATIIKENTDPATDEEYAIIDYTSDPSVVTVYRSSSSHGGGSYRPSTPSNNDNDTIIVTSGNDDSDTPAANITKQVEEDEDSGTITVTVTEEENNDNPSSYRLIIKEKPAEKDGFIENGYSATPYAGGDSEYDGTTVIEDVTPGTPVVLYPRYVNVTVPSALEPETDENGNFLHKVYIYGYPDGEVKPNNNITREEITAAFDRLLNTAYRATIVTTEQDFPDVNNDRWSNESIATMANGGFVVGDENGNFNPSKPITRAEFAVIASKFAPADAELPENYFTDIDGHWAKDYILKIAGQYWISGYTDGKFNPDAYITRAEAMTIINRMLVRYGDEDSDYAKQWPDIDKSDWYYDPVIEATTHNTYVRTENGWSEKWIEE